MNRRKQGNEYEQLAADYLRNKGFEIIESNFYCKMGEIDLIALDDKYLVFVEVKYRKNAGAGSPAEAVDFRKMRKICRSADYYMLTHGYSSDTNVRFDVVAIEEADIKHFVNAFEYIV